MCSNQLLVQTNEQQVSVTISFLARKSGTFFYGCNCCLPCVYIS